MTREVFPDRPHERAAYQRIVAACKGLTDALEDECYPSAKQMAAVSLLYAITVLAEQSLAEDGPRAHDEGRNP